MRVALWEAECDILHRKACRGMLCTPSCEDRHCLPARIVSLAHLCSRKALLHFTNGGLAVCGLRWWRLGTCYLCLLVDEHGILGRAQCRKLACPLKTVSAKRDYVLKLHRAPELGRCCVSFDPASEQARHQRRPHSIFDDPCGCTYERQ